MIIQHNISALQVRNKLITNQNKKIDISEKLASGYQINKAADNAAGLTISEKMRAQIRGLEQNKGNVTDGISLIETADGAMAEMHSMLQRIRELTVQAYNCTNTGEDKQMIQQEISNLTFEIERLSEDTEFNTKPILKGQKGKVNIYDGGYMPSWVTIPNGLQTNNSQVSSSTSQDTTLVQPGSGATGWTPTISDNASAVIDFSNIGVPNAAENLKLLLEKGFYSTCCTCSDRYSICFSADNSVPGPVSGYPTVINISDLITAAEAGTMSDDQIAEALVDRIVDKGNSTYRHFTAYAKNDGKPSQLVLYDWRDNLTPGSSSYGKVVNHISYREELKDVMLQVGPNSQQSLEIVLPKIDLYALQLKFGWNDYYGVVDVTKTVTSYPDAVWGYDTNGEYNIISWGDPVTSTQVFPSNGSLSNVDHAINYVSGERARMGAYQNALEHIYDNVSNTAENTQEAESRIRDSDMAELMVYFARHDLLIDAASSMLAQANQNPQNILKLLEK